MWLGVGWSSQVDKIFQIKCETVLLQERRQKIMSRNRRIIVVGKENHSLTQGPGLHLQHLQPGYTHKLADPLRKQMKVHPLLWSHDQWDRRRNIQWWRMQTEKKGKGTVKGTDENRQTRTTLQWKLAAGSSALPCNQLGIFLDQKLIHCPVNEWGGSLNHECWGITCLKDL